MCILSLQKNTEFMTQLFAKLTDETTSEAEMAQLVSPVINCTLVVLVQVSCNFFLHFILVPSFQLPLPPFPFLSSLPSLPPSSSPSPSPCLPSSSFPPSLPLLTLSRQSHSLSLLSLPPFSPLHPLSLAPHSSSMQSMLLKEINNFSQALQPYPRSAFYQVSCDQSTL